MRRLIFAVLICLVASQAWAAPYSHERMMQLGQDMYRRGILPSGAPMQAFLSGDIPVAGTSLTCVSCHLRSGLGSYEGRVYTPPTNGVRLYQPLKATYKGHDITDAPPLRPAYTDETLALAIRGGVNSEGRSLHAAMPRYMLDDPDMAVLIYYLKNLSSIYSEGYAEGTLKLATVVTEDIAKQMLDAMLIPIKGYVSQKNRMSGSFSQNSRQARMAESMLGTLDSANLRLSLDVWTLRGPQSGWRQQLEDYNSKAPVFALVGGMVNGPWQPVHDFSEAHGIPSLFPNTDLPVISDKDWYTFYISKGYTQEGESAAIYLRNQLGAAADSTPIVQLIRATPQGRALGEGFKRAWSAANPPVDIMLDAGAPLRAAQIERIMKDYHTNAIVLWGDADDMAELDGVSGLDMAIVSGRYVGAKLSTLGEQARKFTLITYPFRLPKEDAKFIKPTIAMLGYAPAEQATQIALSQTFSLVYVLTQSLMDMRGNYYRDNFFDVLGMMPDQKYPLYERLSFGPGQRYASKGCYIVKLTGGPKPELVSLTDWVNY